jgi:AraC-like DNA-binding protein
VSFSDANRDAGSVSLPKPLRSQSWYFCELANGELVQVISTRVAAARRHTLLSGEYFAIHLILRGRLSYVRGDGRNVHRANGPSGMVVRHGSAEDISLDIQPGHLEVLTFYYEVSRIEWLIRNSGAVRRFLAFSHDASLEERSFSALFPIDMHLFNDSIAEFTRSTECGFSVTRRLGLERLSIAVLETFLRHAESLFKAAGNADRQEPNPLILAANDLALNPRKRALRTREAARHLAMSDSKFKAFYKAETGLTYQQFRVQTKQNKAKLLLQNSILSIDQIAEVLGYSHLSSFSRSFKKLEGVTPSEVRRAAVRLRE